MKCVNCKNELVIVLGNDSQPASLSITRNNSRKEFLLYECLNCGLCNFYSIIKTEDLK